MAVVIVEAQPSPDARIDDIAGARRVLLELVGRRRAAVERVPLRPRGEEPRDRCLGFLRPTRRVAAAAGQSGDEHPGRRGEPAGSTSAGHSRAL